MSSHTPMQHPKCTALSLSACKISFMVQDPGGRRSNIAPGTREEGGTAGIRAKLTTVSPEPAETLLLKLIKLGTHFTRALLNPFPHHAACMSSSSFLMIIGTGVVACKILACDLILGRGFLICWHWVLSGLA